MQESLNQTQSVAPDLLLPSHAPNLELGISLVRMGHGVCEVVTQTVMQLAFP